MRRRVEMGSSCGRGAGRVCYDQGGEAPTVTDANVVLG